MPTPDTIHAGLTAIANHFWYLAVFWHLALAALLIAAARGWRPSERTAALVLVLPLASVACLSFVTQNPFNGTAFVLLALVVGGHGVRSGNETVRRGPTWLSRLGIAMVAFAWLYPHFLESTSPLAYLYAAPLGLVPCPTLALVIGFVMILGGLGSRPSSATLAVVGTFYGLFGALRLGVRMDLFLAAGSLALGTSLLTSSHRGAARSAVSTARVGLFLAFFFAAAPARAGTTALIADGSRVGGRSPLEVSSGLSALLLRSYFFGSGSLAVEVMLQGPIAGDWRWGVGTRLGTGAVLPEGFARASMAPRIGRWRPAVGLETGITTRTRLDPGRSDILAAFHEDASAHVSPFYFAVHTAPLSFRLLDKMRVSVLELQVGTHFGTPGRNVRLQLGLLSAGVMF